jgi:hypothetical protein
MREISPVRFGKGPKEKDPNHGHLAGGLLHSEGPDAAMHRGLPDRFVDRVRALATPFRAAVASARHAQRRES